MTVRDLINRLLEYDLKLRVKLADWNEDYSEPSEDAAEAVGIYTDEEGEYVCIGGINYATVQDRRPGG